MKHKIHTALVIAVILFAAQACNLPTTAGGNTPSLPAPNQTLTALFAITPALETETATLPPVVTATSGGDQNAGGGQEPTATNIPSNTPPPIPSQTSAPAATQTPQPTKTSTTVPPTATIPSARTNVKIVANFLATPPVLDGDWSEWKTLTTEYPANHVVFGASNWADQDDLSASYHVGWDANYLYIAVKVNDNKYVQNSTGDNLYKGDSIEILMDTLLQADYYYNKLSPDDFQLGISPGKGDLSGAKEAYLWYPSSIAGKRADVKIASAAFQGGYRVEAAIPWNLFEITPQAGAHYGFVISVSDNDDANKNAQQKMVSNDPNRSLVDPTTWGDIQLVK